MEYSTTFVVLLKNVLVRSVKARWVEKQVVRREQHHYFGDWRAHSLNQSDESARL